MMLKTAPPLREGCLPARESQLVELTARLSGYPPDEMDVVARRLLGISSAEIDDHPFTSRLNNDGSPLQCCVTMSAGERSYRLIGDPGSTIADAHTRHARSLETLEDLLVMQAAPDLVPVVDATCRTHLPADVGSNPAFACGTIWLGVPLGSPGIAVYLKGAWGSVPSQWARVRAWLSQLTAPDAELRDVLRRLERHCSLASIGIEGFSRHASRLKIYVRLRSACRLDELGIDLVQSDRFARVLAAALGEHAISPAGLVISIGVHPGSGAITDVKIDLCGHCLAPFVADWAAFLESIAYHFGVPMPDAGAFEIGRRSEVAFVGFGLKRDQSPRLNLYLKGLARA